MELQKESIESLKRIMGMFNLTYGDLAKEIGISRMTLHDFMKMNVTPQVRNEYKILEYIKTKFKDK